MTLCVFAGCNEERLPQRDFRSDMRNFVARIASVARQRDPDFIVVPQNGLQLLSSASFDDEDGVDPGPPDAEYLAAIDGVAREDLHYGYPQLGLTTPLSLQSEWLAYAGIARAAGKTLVAIDYVSSNDQADSAYASSNAENLLCFASFSRDLDVLPVYPVKPVGDNTVTVSTLGEAANFGYLINPASFSDKDAYLATLCASRYDVLVIDLFWDEATALTVDELARVRQKPQGGNRLILAYMSIGEAESYRWYWNPSWRPGSPSWLGPENPDWAGNYLVRYWEDSWQDIIVGSAGYLDKIISAGFDGVYLDIIDAFERCEELAGM